MIVVVAAALAAAVAAAAADVAVVAAIVVYHEKTFRCGLDMILIVLVSLSGMRLYTDLSPSDMNILLLVSPSAMKPLV